MSQSEEGENVSSVNIVIRYLHTFILENESLLLYTVPNNLLNAWEFGF